MLSDAPYLLKHSPSWTGFDLALNRQTAQSFVIPALDCLSLDKDPRPNSAIAVQALHRARCIGDAPKLPVFRLYLRGTVEERLLQRAAARGGGRVPTRRCLQT